MPSPANQSPANRPSFWLAIVRTLLVQVLVLLALSGAIVGYLSWSSAAAWAEFTAANKPSAPNAPLQAVKAQTPCERKA